MAHSIIDEETLETVAYQRSKIWAKFLTDVEQSADSELGELIDLNKAEQTFQHEDEDSLRGFDEAEEDNVADDINTTACMTKAELTQVLFHADDKDKEAEIKQMLDETMPIIEEHTRKWKAAGLDRILDTFDAQKIERHVGDWMRRHNSNYGDTGMPELTPDKAQRQRYRAADNPTSPKSDNDSDAESMHSVDTARYIRSSRKRNPSSTVKCSPMTTIKMYRTVPRKRDELRAKYNEYAEDREHRHHMQALMHRRDQLHRRRRERELIFHTSPRCYPYSMTDSATVQKRRKQLRKRCESSSLYPSYSSSEDEDHAHGHCDCNACVRRAFSRTAYPYYTYRSHASHSYSRHEYPRNHLEHGSRSMQSMVHFKHNVWQMRRQLACEEDLRPRLMEDECSCCNSDRLCSNAVHIANSSTEEWLVDNKSSPDDRPAPKPQKKRKANLLPNALLKESIQEADEFNIKPRAESKQTLKKEAESKKSKTLVSFSTEEQPKASKNKKMNSDASADNNKSKVNFSIEEQPKATKNKRNNSEASGDNDKSKVKFLIEEQPKARNNKKNNSKATADSDK
ncbi:cal1, partial [Drosophila busckii]